MRLITIFCLAFLLLGACAPSWVEPAVLINTNHLTSVYICVDLPNEQQESAKKAIDGWNQALHQWRVFEIIEGNSSSCDYFVHETEKKPNDEHALAWAVSLGGHEIYMRKGLYEHDTTGILMHELGHILGAQHLPGTLMNPYWFKHGFICPDMSTVAQVAAWNKINLSLLSWCSI